MRYEKIVHGEFISRPNRFIANVKTDRGIVVCHVKNTGRCKELLIPGAEVILEYCPGPGRKTDYDLISVYKNGSLINMDSQAPNKVIGEFLNAGNLFENIKLIKAEKKYIDSRLDFYVEAGDSKIFIEVKGVTLEEEGVVRFPDAPTVRGVKHINDLIKAVTEGYEAYIIFVVQMKGVKYFEPNNVTHPEFGQALEKAVKAGVKVLAFDCIVEENSLEIDSGVLIKI